MKSVASASQEVGKIRDSAGEAGKGRVQTDKAKQTLFLENPWNKLSVLGFYAGKKTDIRRPSPNAQDKTSQVARMVCHSITKCLDQDCLKSLLR